MGRQSCCVKPKLRKGLWSPEEDEKLFNYIKRFGVGCWSTVPKLAGLQRCGKSCRLRWINYLRPDLKRGMFSQQEEDLIISLHKALGNRWAQIAAQLPGRTDNEIKNFWNSSLKKKLTKQGIDPNTHKPMVEVKNCTEKSPAALAEMEQSFHGGLFTEVSRGKPIFDPMYDYDPIRYNSNLLTQYHQQTQTQRPYDQNNLEVNHPSFGFTSMPTLTNFDQGNIGGEADFSDNSNSRISSFLFSEGKESSSNSSNNVNSSSQTGFQMSSSVVENGAFSWGTDSKLESLFHCQMNEIKSEELKTSTSWSGEIQAHKSEDFSSFPLTWLSEDLAGASLDVFHQI